MHILFYDFETTGLPQWKKPSDSKEQPHIVSVAAKQVDDETRKVIQSMHLTVAPSFWDIPQEVVDIHGITQEHALKVGVPERDAAMMLFTLSKQSDLRVAHNEVFDARIMRIALKRYALPVLAIDSDSNVDVWAKQPKECTARRTRGIVPNSRRYPRIEQAYEHFTGKPMENHHDAMADVDACMAVYWAVTGDTGEQTEGQAHG